MSRGRKPQNCQIGKGEHRKKERRKKTPTENESAGENSKPSDENEHYQTKPRIEFTENNPKVCTNN